MEKLRQDVIQVMFPDVPSSDIHSGYHRGTHPVVGGRLFLDVVPVPHLHLHVIIKPYWILKHTLYPPWNSSIWKSQELALKEVRDQITEATETQQEELE